LCDERGDGEEGTLTWSHNDQTVTLNMTTSGGQSLCRVIFGSEVYEQLKNDLDELRRPDTFTDLKTV